MFSYDAQQQDELGFTVNNKLTILRKGDEAEREWWWAKNNYGKEGYVPRNLLGVSFNNLYFLKVFLTYYSLYPTVVSSHRSQLAEFQRITFNQEIFPTKM